MNNLLIQKRTHKSPFLLLNFVYRYRGGLDFVIAVRND